VTLSRRSLSSGGVRIGDVSSEHLAEVERTLLLIAEARERAERTARRVRREEGERRLVEALEDADRALLAVHGELMRSAYFGADASSEQLRLASG
jgi:hypothetical protein